jgi:hypothetical protein
MKARGDAHIELEMPRRSAFGRVLQRCYMACEESTPAAREGAAD